MSDWPKKRSALANLVKYNGDPQAIEFARRDLIAERADDYVRQLVDGAPALTLEQRARLAAVLLGAA